MTVLRFTPILCLTLSILGCSESSTQRSPTAPTPPVATPPPMAAPPPQPSNLVVVWGVVVDPSGDCIEGATVEVVAGPVLVGQRATQRLPCDLVRYSGGFEFDDPVHVNMWEEMTLRASAPGYVSQEQHLSQWPWDRILTFTLVPTGLPAARHLTSDTAKRSERFRVAE